MIEFVVTAEPTEIVIGPPTVLEEVAQNIRMILTTPKGSLAMDRDFGLDFTVLDQPEPRVLALLSADIVSQVARYEPRALVDTVDFIQSTDEAMEGKLIPRVRLKGDM